MAMTGYIEWLLPQMDDLPKKLKKLFNVKRVEFQAKATHGRSGETSAWLYVAYEMMLQYMQHVGVCDDKMARRLLSEAETVLTKLIRDQNGLVEQEKPAEVFLKVLSELFATGKVRVDPLTKGYKNDPYGHSVGEKIGWYDNRFLYLLPDVTYNVVSRFLAGRGERISVSDRTLWKHLDEAKVIQTEIGSDDRVQRCPKKGIPSSKRGTKDKDLRPRLLHLYKTALDTIAA
jgi:hypothetical protein